MLAVELFDTPAGLVINELAMRPHNSGHWSIDGAYTSQFENHLRAVLDWPLGDPRPRQPRAVMANILGGDIEDLHVAFKHVMARDPGLKIHLYGKDVRPGRKVGHVTALGDDVDMLRHGPSTPPTTSRESSMSEPQVAVVMGSDSDWPVMCEAVKRARSSTSIAWPMSSRLTACPSEMLEFGRRAADPRFQGDHRGRGRCRASARGCWRRSRRCR